MQQNEEVQKLGKAIKKLRLEKGKTQADIASAINRDYQSISRLENGRVNPSYTLLLEICLSLEIELDQLWKVVKGV